MRPAPHTWLRGESAQVELGGAGFESQVCSNLAVWPWEGPFAALCPSFFICTVGRRMLPEKAMVRITRVRYLAQYLLCGRLLTNVCFP